MAFHDPIDAISWCLEVQQQLVLLPWPDKLLTQPDAAVRYCPVPAFSQSAIFKGLRVRMAVYTGEPDTVQVQQSNCSCTCASVQLDTQVYALASYFLEIN